MAYCQGFLFCCIYFLFQFVSIKCQKPLAPALYVFGDSQVDSGNNNFLQTRAKANYKPYGTSFPSGVTGRFTNGKTTADVIANSLGLPFIRPYLSLSNVDKNKTITGVNYASGGAGILPETGSVAGKVLSLGDQIQYFHETVTKDLPHQFESPTKLSKYLAEAIFIVSIGSNDYINNYLDPTHYNSSKQYNPQQFADLLVNQLKQHLMEIFNLGGRKFVVFELATIGCLPAIVNSVNPKPVTPCVETINRLILTYNAKLPHLIRELGSILRGSTFVLGNTYQRIYNMNISPIKYGFTAGRAPCCIVGNTGTCAPNQLPCKDGSKHIYYDALHPTEHVYTGVAMDCFSGSSTCFPINIQRLTQKQ